MQVQQDRLVSLVTLCARMRLLLDQFGHDGALHEGDYWWAGTANLLFPAACVTRVDTNASAADLYDAAAYCSPAGDYDDRQSALLDDYMSALARFHFVWNAYESARSRSAAGRLMTSKDAEDRKTLVARVPEAHLQWVGRVYRSCLSLAQNERGIMGRFEEEREAQVVGKAGLLAGAFRHFIYHGDENPPEPDDWDERFQGALDGEETVSLQAYRLVLFTRLAVHLLQVLTHAELRGGSEMEFGYVPFLSRMGDYEFEIPCRLVLNLASCWPEMRDLTLSREAIETVARGCGASSDVLKLVEEAANGAG